MKKVTEKELAKALAEKLTPRQLFALFGCLHTAVYGQNKYAKLSRKSSRVLDLPELVTQIVRMGCTKP